MSVDVAFCLDEEVEKEVYLVYSMKEREERDRELILYLFVWFLRVFNLNIFIVFKCIFVVILII